VPLPAALLHQAMAMLVLTVATVHAASATRRAIYPLIAAQAGMKARPPALVGRSDLTDI